ncbi:MAG TPA: hypothetical protein VFL82_05845 [Thermomicrobiales bacterium]|nr:hypothetical protein [Thermomicrobiales bacterium]
MSQANTPKSKRGERPSRRAERRLAAERAAKRRRYTFFGGAIALAVLVAIILVVANLDKGSNSNLPAIAAAPPLDASIPTDGRTMGDPNAPVTFVEWGDYQ